MIAWVVNLYPELRRSEIPASPERARLHQRTMRPRPPIYQPLGSIGLAPVRLSSFLPFLSFQSLTNCPRFATLSEPLSFQSITNRPICKPFVLITVQQCRGWVGGQQGGAMKVILELRRQGIHRNQVVSLRTFQRRQRHCSLRVSVHSAPLRYLFLPLPPTFKRSPRIPFRINTCRTASKQTTLSTFRINTYEKTRGEGALMVNQISGEEICPQRAPRVGSILTLQEECPSRGRTASGGLRHSPLATRHCSRASHASPVTSRQSPVTELPRWVYNAGVRTSRPTEMHLSPKEAP